MMPASEANSDSDTSSDWDESSDSGSDAPSVLEVITLSSDEELETNPVLPEALNLVSSSSSGASSSGMFPNMSRDEVHGLSMTSEGAAAQGRQVIEGRGTAGVLPSDPTTANPEVITLSDDESEDSEYESAVSDDELANLRKSGGPPPTLAIQPQPSSSRSQVPSARSKSTFLVSLGLIPQIALTETATPTDLTTRKRSATKCQMASVSNAKKICFQGKVSVAGIQQGPEPGPAELSSSGEEFSDYSDNDEDSADKKSQGDPDVDV